MHAVTSKVYQVPGTNKAQMKSSVSLAVQDRLLGN